MVKVKRVLHAIITLVTDDYINYVTTYGNEGYSQEFFAYYDYKNWTRVFEKAIKENIPMELLIERLRKGKEFDYVTEIRLKVSE